MQPIEVASSPHNVALPACISLGDSDTIRTVFCGHSHTINIMVSLLTSAHNRDMGVFFGYTVNEEYLERLQLVVAGRAIIISWMGNQHNSSFLFEHASRFDLLASEAHDDPVIEGYRLVPEEMVRAHFAPSLVRLQTLIHEIQDAGARSVSIIGTPAPRGQPEEIRPLFEKEGAFSHYAEIRGFDLNTVSITPLSVRVKLWLLLQRQMDESAIATGARFIPVPEQSLEDDRSLKKEFWAEDVTHANAAYGSLVVQQVGALLGEAAFV